MPDKTTIDWTNPPKPGAFMQVTLVPKHFDNPEPGLVAHGLLVVRGNATVKKCPALKLRAVLYYVREAALKDAEFRADLDRMVAALPTIPRGGFTDGEKGLITSRGAIFAIKAYHTRTGCSLVEAKAALDAYLKGRSPPPSKE